MFGIGFQELVLLSLIGLIVLGPERLPRVANQIGGWLGQARRMTRVMKRQLEDEIDFEKDLNIKPPSREPSSQPAPQMPSDEEHNSAADEAAESGASSGDDEAADTDTELAATTAKPGDIEATAEDVAGSGGADLAEEPVSKEAP